MDKALSSRYSSKNSEILKIRAKSMTLENSLRRLGAVVADLEKVAAQAPASVAKKGAQIDMFAGIPSAKPSVDNTLMAKTLDRTIERIENLLQVGSR